MTTASLQAFLAALLLYSGANLPDGESPNEVPARQPAPSSPKNDQSVSKSFSADVDTIVSPFGTPRLAPDAVGGARRGRARSMPANPFSAVPPGATAMRKAAIYGAFVGPAPAVGTGKAFAGVRPTPAVSPYMGLYAPRTLGVDNYNAYVRPQLQQEGFNRQVEGQFQTIESGRGAAEAAARSFDQLYTVGPAASGATFMNFQPYYPSYPSSR